MTLAYWPGCHLGSGWARLVSPVTFRPAADGEVRCHPGRARGGRAFCGLGAGWYDREHAAYGLPSLRPERLDRLEATSRPSGRSGPPARNRTRAAGSTCPTRPATRGRWARCRSSWVEAANAGPSRSPPSWRTAATCGWTKQLAHKIEVLRPPPGGSGPRPAMVTVLDLPVIGRDREDTGRRVEQVRGRLSATAYAARRAVGPVEVHRRRWADLADLGVGQSSSPCPTSPARATSRSAHRCSPTDRASVLRAGREHSVTRRVAQRPIPCPAAEAVE